MKAVIFSLLTFFFSAAAFSQDYVPVDQGSSVKFKLKNFGLNTGGTFSGLKGTIHFDKDNPEASSFDVSLDANSVNTTVEMRDNHLREEEYFDVKNYPRISFVSTSVKAAKGNSYNISGKLTLKGKSKEIEFPFVATQSEEGYVFTGEFKISRKEFGIGGSSTISDKVNVSLCILAKK